MTCEKTEPKQSWSKFASALRDANPRVLPEVEHRLLGAFEEQHRQLGVYWCPHAGNNCEPLVFDVPNNPLRCRIFPLRERDQHDRYILWTDNNLTRTLEEGHTAQFEARIPMEIWGDSVPNGIYARVEVTCLQRLILPVRNGCGNMDYSHRLGVFRARVLNRDPEGNPRHLHERPEEGDTYYFLATDLSIDNVLRQVFLPYGLKLKALMLVDTDLRPFGESATSVVAKIDKLKPLVESPTYTISPETASLTWRRTAMPTHDLPDAIMRPGIHAWARAMLDALAHPERQVRYTIRIGGLGDVVCLCNDFVDVSEPEREVLRTILRAPAEVVKHKVLDIGCGVGRHLQFIRDNIANVELWATESDPYLREYCFGEFGPNMYAKLNDCAEKVFDTVLLLGNGPGLFKTRQGLETGLREILMRLRPGGVLIGNSAPHPGTVTYSEEVLSISYPGSDQTIQSWIFTQWSWLIGVLQQTGFELVFEQQCNAPGTHGNLWVARRPK